MGDERAERRKVKEKGRGSYGRKGDDGREEEGEG